MSRRVGIVGCGGIARYHLQAFLGEKATIVGVTDCNPEAAGKFAEEAGGAAVYESHQRLYDKARPEIVSICTPPVAHEEAALEALGRGIHVLCEKPLAHDLASAHRIGEAVARSKALLMPAFRHRFVPGIAALQELVASGKLGDLVLFNNIFCYPAFEMEDKWFTKKAIAGGGSLLDTNSHSVDLFRFLVGEIVEQKAVMHRHFKTTDVEDAGILLVKAAEGALGALESAFVAGSGVAFVDLIGTKGRARFDYSEPSKIRYCLKGQDNWNTQSVAESLGFAEEVRHFLGAARGRHELAVTVEDGVRCMEVICAVYNSA